jgi:ribosomal silencing factor RsfS
MGGWCEGSCQEAGGEKLEECCKEQGQLAEASKEGLGSEWAVVPMMMIVVVVVMQKYRCFYHGK